MKPTRRVSIRGVRLRALAGVVAAGLAVPLGLALVGGDDLPAGPTRAPGAGGPVASTGQGDPTADRRPVRLPVPGERPNQVDDAGHADRRARAADARSRPTGDLLAALRSPEPSQRLDAANALWARGLRQEVEAEAAASADRVLLAKVQALRAKRP